MSIHVLPPQVANQIAAGEVVERPSAVVKELVENAFDAGASAVQVEIEQGGSSLILVRDNGSGIVKEDLPLALKRHATSKLQLIEDLDYLSTMGFRGEALASVAAVSRLSLTSKPAEQEYAWSIKVEGIGQEPSITPAAHPAGTTVEVADLFFNTPARRRFLRSEKSEFLHVEEIFRRLALSRPDCSLILKNNGRLVYDFRPESVSDRPNRRMAKIFGKEFADNACRIEAESDDMTMSGFCAIEEVARPLQYFFINGRIVRDKAVMRAMTDAYEEVLGRKTVDSYVCFLHMPQSEIDINVHPQKFEVRFQNARLVHDFIAGAVVNALRNSTQLFPERIEETNAVPLGHDYCAVKPLVFSENSATRFVTDLDAQAPAPIAPVQSESHEELYARFFSRPNGYSSNSINVESGAMGHTSQYSPDLRNFASLAQDSGAYEEKSSAISGSSTVHYGELWHSNQEIKGEPGDLFGVDFGALSQTEADFNSSSDLISQSWDGSSASTAAIKAQAVDEHTLGGPIGSLPPTENSVFFAPWFASAPEPNQDYNLVSVSEKHFATVLKGQQLYIMDLARLARELCRTHLLRERNRALKVSKLLVSVSIPCSQETGPYISVLQQLGFAVVSKGKNLEISAVPVVMRCMNVARIVSEILEGVPVEAGEKQAIEFFSDVLCKVKMPLYFTSEMAERLLGWISSDFAAEESQAVRKLPIDKLIKELFSE